MSLFSPFSFPTLCRFPPILSAAANSDFAVMSAPHYGSGADMVYLSVSRLWPEIRRHLKRSIDRQRTEHKRPVSDMWSLYNYSSSRKFIFFLFQCFSLSLSLSLLSFPPGSIGVSPFGSLHSFLCSPARPGIRVRPALRSRSPHGGGLQEPTHQTHGAGH